MDGSRYQYELSKSITQKGDEMVRSFKGGTRRRKNKNKRYTYYTYAPKYKSKSRYLYKKQHKSRRRK
jgi:hypothetical protein